MSDTYPGIYKAVVIDNDDPLHSYRILTRIPAVLGDADSNWCDPILPTLYKPRVGEIVWVQFADGDPGQPIYQSRVHVTSEMADPDVGGSSGTGIVVVGDFSITPRKMNNNLHYLY